MYFEDYMWLIIQEYFQTDIFLEGKVIEFDVVLIFPLFQNHMNFSYAEAIDFQILLVR